MARATDDMWTQLHDLAPPMIVWQQEGRNFGDPGYTYGALFIQRTQTWYLAGDAEYYGSREINDNTMRLIIMDSNTESWWFNTNWKRGDKLTS